MFFIVFLPIYLSTCVHARGCVHTCTQGGDFFCKILVMINIIEALVLIFLVFVCLILKYLYCQAQPQAPTPIGG